MTLEINHHHIVVFRRESIRVLFSVVFGWDRYNLEDVNMVEESITVLTPDCSILFAKQKNLESSKTSCDLLMAR